MDSALVESNAIIYGEMNADSSLQRLTFNAKTNLHVHVGAFGRSDAYDITTADTWLTLKMDTSCVNTTTSGFAFNSDSTGVVVGFTGYLQFSGHAKLLNSAASNQTANFFIRLLKNSTEQTEFNTAVGRVFNSSGAHDLVSATGVIPVTATDTLKVQIRTDNTNIDLEQIDSGVFDKSNVFIMFLMQVKSLKEYE